MKLTHCLLIDSSMNESHYFKSGQRWHEIIISLFLSVRLWCSWYVIENNKVFYIKTLGSNPTSSIFALVNSYTKITQWCQRKWKEINLSSFQINEHWNGKCVKVKWNVLPKEWADETVSQSRSIKVKNCISWRRSNSSNDFIGGAFSLQFQTSTYTLSL